MARAKENLRAIGDGGVSKTWTLVEGDREIMSMPVGAVLRSIMLNHWYHHRGQLSVYLRELNVPVRRRRRPIREEQRSLVSSMSRQSAAIHARSVGVDSGPWGPIPEAY